MRTIKQIKIWDWLLIFGTLMAPMTSLRFGGRIGPAELMMFVWALRVTDFRTVRISFVEKFFIAFLLALFCGSMCGLLIAPKELSRQGWITWPYMAFISHALFSYLKRNDREYNACLFNLICILVTITQFGLYEYAVNGAKKFMGAQLWFAHRYSGGGKNPHQVAILFCGITFWHAYKVLKEKKLIYIVLVYLSVFLMTKTYSSTGDAALVLGFVSIFVTWIIGLEHSKPKKLMFIMLGFVVLLCLGFLFRERLIKELNDWINGDSNGRGRLLIWSSITDLLKKSPVWGLGAGTHGHSGKIEFHNSYLEIIAATGLVGLSTFVIFSYKLFEKILKAEPMLISIVISMYGYSTGGFAFRRIVYWILTIFALVIAVQTGQERDYRQGLELRHDDMI